MSLIEMAVVMAFVSLALVPVVQMIGKPSSDTGNVARLTAMKSQEAVLGNAVVERALSGDYSVIVCGGTNLDPTTLPPGNQNVCRDDQVGMDYNQDLYYQWTIKEASSGMPDGNHLYQATLNVYDNAGGASGGKPPMLTVPTYFFYNDKPAPEDEGTTGIVLSLDVSGSMAQSNSPSTGQTWPSSGVPSSHRRTISSPYMFHRYEPGAIAQGGIDNVYDLSLMASGYRLNKWDDAQLDVVYGQQVGAPTNPLTDPNTETPFLENFPYTTRLFAGTATPYYNTNLPPGNDCSQSNTGNGTYLGWTAAGHLQFFFPKEIIANNTAKNRIMAICKQKANSTDWEDTINQDLSRLEAARSAAVGLLLTMESNKSLIDNIQMGFNTWSSGGVSTSQPDSKTVQVPLESATAVFIPPASGEKRFQNMRDRLLWINRADPRAKNQIPMTIQSSGGTQINWGLEMSRDMLLAPGKNYKKRIIVLLSDGQPNPNSGDNKACTGGPGNDPPANNCQNQGLGKMAYEMGLGAPQDQQITIYTVGLIAADEKTMKAIAWNTPGGKAFIAKSITELGPIFQQIAYSAETEALLAKTNRYDW